MNYLLPSANLAISWGLLILIWLVQLIIYPGFQRISREAFTAYHRWYVIRISAVVLPLMVAELVLTIWWILSDAYSPISLSAGFFVIIVWISTFVLQVPTHNRLKTGKDQTRIQRLVMTNWIRTMAWSLKAGLVSIDTISSIPWPT
ncbi:MAG: hypothetical protein PVF37_17310 [Desulfobacterales bacterium]|jgi:hypothetical protein